MGNLELERPDGRRRARLLPVQVCLVVVLSRQGCQQCSDGDDIAVFRRGTMALGLSSGLSHVLFLIYILGTAPAPVIAACLLLWQRQH